MTDNTGYIRFDWAIKRILRDKANFGVLEGLMTVLLGDKTTIVEILESGSNREHREDKSNRVDVKAKTSQGEIIIVEVQLARERHFMQRILYGASKAVIEQLQIGQDYENIKKVYSINVLYFDLGDGDDFVYHGYTTFVGMNKRDSVLRFKNEREEAFVKESARAISPDEVFPEYFLLRVNQFNEVATTPIEEWMDYLKSGVIRKDTKTPGLQEALEKLRVMSMTPDERHDYEEYMVSVHAAKDAYDSAVADGWERGWEHGHAQGVAAGHAQGVAEGHAQGVAEGHAQGVAEGIEQGEKRRSMDIARKMKAVGMTIEEIISLTGLTTKDLADL